MPFSRTRPKSANTTAKKRKMHGLSDVPYNIMPTFQADKEEHEARVREHRKQRRVDRFQNHIIREVKDAKARAESSDEKFYKDFVSFTHSISEAFC